MFTYCPAEAIEAAEAGRIPPVFDDVAPPRLIRLRVNCCCWELFAKFIVFLSFCKINALRRRRRVYILSCRGY